MDLGTGEFILITTGVGADISSLSGSANSGFIGKNQNNDGGGAFGLRSYSPLGALTDREFTNVTIHGGKTIKGGNE